MRLLLDRGRLGYMITEAGIDIFNFFCSFFLEISYFTPFGVFSNISHIILYFYSFYLKIYIEFTKAYELFL